MASLLSLGNPLSSERGEPRALGHLAKSREEPGFAGCQRLNFLGDATRAPLPRSPERNLTWMWTLILSLSWLAQSSLQAAYRISLAYSGPTGSFKNNYGGALLQLSYWDSFYIYNNYDLADDSLYHLLRAYSQTGTLLGSVDSQISSAEGVVNPVADKVVVLGKLTGIGMYVAQTMNFPTSVAFTSDPQNDPNLAHGQAFSGANSLPGTGYVLAFDTSITSAPKFYRIDVNSLTSYVSGSDFVPGNVRQIEVSNGGALVVLGENFLSAYNLYDLSSIGQIYQGGIGKCMSASDAYSGYIGSLNNFSPSVSKIALFAGSWTELETAVTLTSDPSNLVQMNQFNLIVVSESPGYIMSILTMYPFKLHFSVSLVGLSLINDYSMRLGQLLHHWVGHHMLISATSSAFKRFELLDVHANYCKVDWQDPCLLCEDGRYLSNTSLGNICWTKPEIPLRHGISGLQVSPCLGDLSKQCLECLDNSAICTACMAGYYMKEGFTDGCYSNNLEGFGLKIFTPNNVLAACSDTNCTICSANYSQCTQCNPGFYLRHPSDGKCYANSVPGYGLITVSGVGLRTTACLYTLCVDCYLSYNTCLQCGNNTYLKELTTTTCYLNNLIGWGLKPSSPKPVLAKCTRSDCKYCPADYTYCTDCNTGFYLRDPEDGSCYKNNLLGYGLVTIAGKIKTKACQDTKCTKCFSAYNVCTQCTTGFYLKEGFSDICYANALDGFGIKTMAGVDVLAACSDANCRKCQASYTTCTQCNAGYYLGGPIDGVCFLNNNAGYGSVVISGVTYLRPCADSNCIECFADYLVCTLCNTNYYLKEGSSKTCFTNTLPGFGIKVATPQNKLAVCSDSNCITCTANYAYCTYCNSGFYLRDPEDGNCYANTISGFGLVTISGVVKTRACQDPLCADCFSVFSSCRLCNPGFYLQEGTSSNCQTNTLAGYGLKSASPQNVLAKCLDSNCQTCTLDYGFCTGCNPSYYLKDISDGICYQNNIPGMGLVTILGVPKLASCSETNCKSCYNSISVCTECLPTYFLKHGTTDLCFSNVLNRFGLRSIASISYLDSCLDTNCEKCFSDYAVCTECQANYYLRSPSNGNCYPNTVVGYGLTVVAGNSYVKACSESNCVNCFSQYDQCQICASGYYLKEGTTTTCYTNSLVGFGLKSASPQNLLAACSDTNCATCDLDYGYCTACNSGFFLRHPADGKCYPNTLPGYGLVTVSGVVRTTLCQDTHCADCFASYTACLQCGSGYYLKDGTTSTCYTNSLTGFGLKTASPQNVLAVCTDPNCATCAANYAYCTACNSGFYLRDPEDGKCYKNDVSGYGLTTVAGVVKTKACQDTQCADCYAAYGSCLQCKTNYYLKEGTTTICYTNTLSGFGLKTALPQNVLATCTDTNCLDCSLDSSYCRGCNTGFYLRDPEDGKCYKNDIQGYGLITVSAVVKTRTCQHSQCEECFTSYSLCTKCKSGYYLKEGATDICYTNTLTGFGMKTATPINVLASCSDTNCANCQASYTTCTQCNAGYYLGGPTNGVCYANNNAGYGAITISGQTYLRTCLDANCNDCYADHQVCLICNSNYYLKEGTTSTCYTNTLSGFGLKTASPQNVLATCIDTNCATCDLDYGYCTACNSGFFLRHPADGKCYPNTLPGYGLVTVSGVVRTTLCQDTHCADCFASYTACLQCGSGYYLKDGTTSTCYTNSLTGFGLKTASPQNVLAVCTDPNCATCAANYAYCTACNSGFYLRDPEDGKCYKNDVSGYGLTTVAGVVKTKACQDTQCADCYAAYGSCLQCKTNYYLKEGTTTICYTNSLAGYGLKTASPQNVLATCSMPNCANCPTNYASCTQCNSGYYLRDPEDGKCYQNNISGYGFITISGVVKTRLCQDTKCSNCSTSYTACTQCTSGYYLKQGTTDICYTNTLVGYGLKTASPANVLAICTDPNCKICQSSYAICTQCNSGYFLRFPSDGKCYLNNTAGYGSYVDSGVGKVRPCADSNCIDCYSNYAACLQCTSTYYLKDGTTSTCYQNNLVGYGIKTSTPQNKLAGCSDPNCKYCLNDYITCTECQTNYYLRYPSDGKCYQNSTSRYGSVTIAGTGMVRLCQDTNCDNCLGLYTSCSTCLSGYYLKDGTDTICYQNNLVGFGIKTSAPQNRLAACADSNCLSCYADYQICTACKTGFWVYLNGCSSGQPQMGPDTNGYLQSCSVGFCSDCHTDFQVCLDCFLPRYLPEGVSSSCILNDRDRFGLKLSVTPIVIAPCINHCTSCLADITTCTVCDSGYYPTDQNSNICVLNSIGGKGLSTVAGRQTLSACLDVNCAECFSTYAVCELCKPNWYLRLGQENTNPGCFENNTPGFGLTAAVPPKIAPCLPTNCVDCYSSQSVCRACKPNTYQKVGTQDCITNTQNGYGLTLQAGATVLDKCTVANCENCYDDLKVCRQCTSPFLYNPATKECSAVPVIGMGRSNDPSGFPVLLNCADTNCFNCADSIGTCVACKSKWMLDSKTGLCIPKPIYDSSNPLTVKQPCFFDRRTSTFLLEFSQPLDTVNVALVSLLDFKLISKDDKIQPIDKTITIEMKINSQGKVEGRVSSSKIVNTARLGITQKNQSQVIFLSGTRYLPSDSTIYVEEVALTPESEASKYISVLGRRSTSGVATASLAMSGAVSGAGFGFASFLKAIDHLRYLLYISSPRIAEAESFLHIFTPNIAGFLPNVFSQMGQEEECTPHPNFAREGVSCSLLQNEGSGVLLLLGLAGITLQVWLLEKAVGSMKDSSLKSVLKGILYVPGKLFSVPMLLLLFDSFQITFMRSALLTMNNYGGGSGVAAVLNLVTSIAAIGGYCFVGVLVVKNSDMYLVKGASDKDGQINPTGAPVVKTSSETNRYFGDFFRGFRQVVKSDQTKFTDKHLRFVPGLMLLKNLLFQICLIFGTDGGAGQLIGFMSLDTTALVIHFIFRPQASNIGFILQTSQLLSELFVSFTLNLSEWLKNTISFDAQQKYFGPTILIFFAVIIGSAAIMMISETCKGILQILRTQKSKVLPVHSQVSISQENQVLKEKKAEVSESPIQRKNSTVTTKSGTTTVKNASKSSKPTQPAKIRQTQVPIKFHQNGLPAHSPAQKLKPAKQILPQQSNLVQAPLQISPAKPRINAYTSLLKPVNQPPIWPGSPTASVFSPGPTR